MPKVTLLQLDRSTGQWTETGTAEPQCLHHEADQTKDDAVTLLTNGLISRAREIADRFKAANVPVLKLGVDILDERVHAMVQVPDVGPSTFSCYVEIVLEGIKGKATISSESTVAFGDLYEF